MGNNEIRRYYKIQEINKASGNKVNFVYVPTALLKECKMEKGDLVTFRVTASDRMIMIKLSEQEIKVIKRVKEDEKRRRRD